MHTGFLIESVWHCCRERRTPTDRDCVCSPNSLCIAPVMIFIYYQLSVGNRTGRLFMRISTSDLNVYATIQVLSSFLTTGWSSSSRTVLPSPSQSVAKRCTSGKRFGNIQSQHCAERHQSPTKWFVYRLIGPFLSLGRLVV